MTTVNPISRSSASPTGGVPGVRELDWLDSIFESDAPRALRALLAYLGERRQSLGAEQWKRFCRLSVQNHPIIGKLQRSPLARRSFQKPRGYSGDAVLFDMIFSPELVTSRLPQESRAVYEWEVSTCFANSVRARRDKMAAVVDDAAARKPGVSAAVIGAGHLREAQISRAAAEGRLSQILAFDHDAQALAAIAMQQQNVRTMQGVPMDILTGRAGLGNYDLILASSVYDSLPSGVAELMTAELFKKLNPGGRLVVGVLSPEQVEAAYLEACLDWWIEYWSPQKLQKLLNAIPAANVAFFRVFNVSGTAALFLDIQRTGDATR